MYTIYLLAGLLFGCVKPTPPVVIVPLATVTNLGPVAVELESFECEIWGGDGDGIEAVWSQELTLVARNPRDEVIAVEGVSWTLNGELREVMALERSIQGGGEERFILDAHLTYEELQRLRDGGQTVELAITLRWRDLDGEQMTGIQQHWTPEHC